VLEGTFVQSCRARRSYYFFKSGKIKV